MPAARKINSLFRFHKPPHGHRKSYMCGIGPRMQDRLIEAGISNIAELWAADAQFLKRTRNSIVGLRFTRCCMAKICRHRSISRFVSRHSSGPFGSRP